MTHREPTPNWTDQEIDQLKQAYGITSVVELAKALIKDPQEVRIMIETLGLRNALIQTDDPDRRLKLTILQLMNEQKRFLPNGWLVGLAMGRLMVRSLVEQIKKGDTWIEEVEEEINAVLDAIVKLYEFSPLLTVGDMLKGEDHGQAYRITGREFIPADKWITYYFTYLYRGDDIPEEYDDDDGGMTKTE
ncbi:hypothetical protein [Spirosoma areae]